MIGFRHADPRYPFLWEGPAQPAGRWHGEGEGPVHPFADTPDGAWAEFLRHEEIRDAAEVSTIRRALWAVDLGEPPRTKARLAPAVLTGGRPSYPACRAEARRLRARGGVGFVAPAAALLPGAAHGWRVEGGLVEGPRRDGKVIVLFGRRPELTGWLAAAKGRPAADLLPRVRHFPSSRPPKLQSRRGGPSYDR